MNFLGRFLAAMSRQISVILALASYENNRQPANSSAGSWESLVNPLQIMLIFFGIRIGFRFLMSGGSSLAGSATNIYFNIVIFMAAGFTIYFPFRQLAIQALSGLKLRSPLYYKRIEPIDILLALSLNNVRALLTLTLGLMALIWALTWDFRMDSPGLALWIYLLSVLMAIGFGICLVFLGKYNKFVTRLIKRLINRILILTSGLFFATFELPAYSRPFVTWNPVLHAVELFRYSLNNQYPIPGISLSYLTWCSLVLLGFSLILYRTNESSLLEAFDD